MWTFLNSDWLEEQCSFEIYKCIMPGLRSRPANKTHQKEACRSRFAFQICFAILYPFSSRYSLKSIYYLKMNLSERDIPRASLNGWLLAEYETHWPRFGATSFQVPSANGALCIGVSNTEKRNTVHKIIKAQILKTFSNLHKIIFCSAKASSCSFLCYFTTAFWLERYSRHVKFFHV